MVCGEWQFDVLLWEVSLNVCVGVNILNGGRKLYTLIHDFWITCVHSFLRGLMQFVFLLSYERPLEGLCWGFHGLIYIGSDFEKRMNEGCNPIYSLVKDWLPRKYLKCSNYWLRDTIEFSPISWSMLVVMCAWCLLIESIPLKVELWSNPTYL